MKPYTVCLTILWLTLISLVACQPNSTTLQSKNLVLDWIRGSVVAPAPLKPPRHCFANISSATHHPPYWLLAVAANTGALTETNADAKRFKEAMQKRYSIPEQQICVLEDVYRQELVAALQVLKERVTNQDLAIIYFSGHGSQLDSSSSELDTLDEALVTYDIPSRESEEAASCDNYVLRDKSFVALANALPTTRVLTVIDACFAGGMYMPPTIDHLPAARLKFFVGGCLDVSLPPYKTAAVKNLDKLKGLFLSAAAEGEYAQAWEVPGGGGIFTTKLVEALEQAPAGKFKEAFAQAAEQVSEEIRKLKPAHPQRPKDHGPWELVE